MVPNATSKGSWDILGPFTVERGDWTDPVDLAGGIRELSNRSVPPALSNLGGGRPVSWTHVLPDGL